MKLYLREWREHNRLSLITVADRAGIAKGYLSTVEQEKANPTLDVIDRIAEALGMAPEKLVGRPPDPRDPTVAEFAAGELRPRDRTAEMVSAALRLCAHKQRQAIDDFGAAKDGLGIFVVAAFLPWLFSYAPPMGAGRRS